MKNAFILMVVIVIASCSSTKQVIQTDTQVETVLTSASTITEQAQAETKVTDVVKSTTSESDSAVITETVIELSRPDSLGNQHAEKITQRTITKGGTKKNETVASKEAKTATAESATVTAQQTETQSIDSQVALKTKVKKPQVIKIAILIGVLAVLGLLFFKFKHLIL